MKILLNGQPVDTAEGTTLASLLADRGLDAPGMAVAVNNRVVPRPARNEFQLLPDMNIIVIKAACGG